MEKVLFALRLFLSSCCLAFLFQIGHATEPAIPVSAGRKSTSADASSLSGQTFGHLVLAEKLGIDHQDQVVDFDYTTNTSPFYVTEADGTIIRHQSLSGGKLALRVRN